MRTPLLLLALTPLALAQNPAVPQGGAQSGVASGVATGVPTGVPSRAQLPPTQNPTPPINAPHVVSGQPSHTPAPPVQDLAAPQYPAARASNAPYNVNGMPSQVPPPPVMPGVPSTGNACNGTLIDFELGAPCTFGATGPLRNEYAAQGVVFGGPGPLDGGAVLDECGNFGVNAHSGTNFFAFNRNATMGNGGVAADPAYMKFTGTASSVSIMASGGGTDDTIEMRAYDLAGNMIATTGGVPCPAGTWTQLSVAASGISTVELIETSGDCCFLYDDLCFETGCTLIDFELGAPCAFGATGPLRNEYAAQGVVFGGPGPLDGGAVLDECGNFGVNAHSGTNFFAFNRNATMGNGGVAADPAYMKFAAPVTSISIMASGGGNDDTIEMGAYDAAGNLIAFTGPVLCPAGTWTKLTLCAEGIASAVLVETGGDCCFVYDDLCFEGGGTVVDFELGAPCFFSQTGPLRNEYAAQGVVFGGPGPLDGGAVLDECGNFGVNARSGSNFFAFNRNATMGNGGLAADPAALTFTTSISSASIWASGAFTSDTIEMLAYDGAGNLIDTSGPVLCPAGIWTQLSVAAGGITRVELVELSGDCCFVYDDLCFVGGGGGGQPCTVSYCEGTANGNEGDLTIDTCVVDGGPGNTLTLSNSPAALFGYPMIAATQGSVNPPGSIGELCVGPAAIGRYNKDLQSTGGSGGYSVDIFNSISGGGGGGIPAAAGGGVLMPGDTWNFQCWNRIAGSSTFSAALQVTFQ